MSALMSVDGIGKDFAGLAALADVSFEVNEGEIVGIIGPNGAGKSTLFNCIGGAFRPSRGSIRLDGVDVTGRRPDQLAKLGVGRTFQLMKPFGSMTALENVIVPALLRHGHMDVAHERAVAVLERVGLVDWAARSSEDLSTAGRKRLELARALALEPRILLLDEVMSGLVPAEREPLLRLLRELRDEGATLLFVEHVMHAVMSLSDRLIVLHHGRLLAQGSPEEVAGDPLVVEAYLGGES